jgi:hypothetical protein
MDRNKRTLEILIDKPNIDIVVRRTLGFGLGFGLGLGREKGKDVRETDMLNSLQRKLEDDVYNHQEITVRHGTWGRSGTNRHTYVYVCTDTVGTQ